MYSKINEDIDNEFINFGRIASDIIRKRYEYIKGVMRPNARMRCLHQYQYQLETNISYLERFYREKVSLL